MIGQIVAARRRLAWHRRLTMASCRPEINAGARPALWIFDSLRGPDGYALRAQMHALATREGLNLHAFGPFEDEPSIAGMSALRGDFDRLLAERIAVAAAQCNARLFLTGSAKGAFAAAIDPEAELWEVQHGLLDPSYLPMRADRFFIRSSSSRDILEKAGYGDRLVTLSQDLSPPHVTTDNGAVAMSVVCYSKNPGGGCTATELAGFERAVIAMAARRKLPVELRQHPRDSRAKLIARHRGTAMLRYLRRRPTSATGAKLIVSSFSTALTSESMAGDLLLNVALKPVDPIVAAEYQWLPTVSVEALAKIRDLPAVRRV